MPQAVDFTNVSAEGLESSPEIEALPSLGANGVDGLRMAYFEAKGEY